MNKEKGLTSLICKITLSVAQKIMFYSDPRLKGIQNSLDEMRTRQKQDLVVEGQRPVDYVSATMRPGLERMKVSIDTRRIPSKIPGIYVQ